MYTGILCIHIHNNHKLTENNICKLNIDI
jgi:hypothetical protein